MSSFQQIIDGGPDCAVSSLTFTNMFLSVFGVGLANKVKTTDFSNTLARIENRCCLHQFLCDRTVDMERYSIFMLVRKYAVRIYCELDVFSRAVSLLIARTMKDLDKMEQLQKAKERVERDLELQKVQ